MADLPVGRWTSYPIAGRTAPTVVPRLVRPVLRQGAAGDFGYLHALVDHGLDEETVASVIVNNAAGIRQPNGRFLHGLRYGVGGVGIGAVEVHEQRTPHEDFVDGDGAGVITAFCLGLDRCPEGIDESIP